jgi:ABC-2 type transport system ATP-binding protein
MICCNPNSPVWKMIEVEHLSKIYPGGLAAVRDVSFAVERGEVVGFLGPNGAGKSTTMRILSGFISPSGGTVRVGGVDVTRDSLRVRSQIGYLPENCPLYPEMRVCEYLRYRANLKGVPPRHLRSRVDRVTEQCGLGEVSRRLIGQLSKGFRQRVGIADALVHNPDLLILDEPTIGLDPNQILLIRRLIAELSEVHTLLISTHILQEVEASCDRVLVLNRGEIVESAPLAELQSRWCGRSRIRLEVRAEENEAVEFCRGLPGYRDHDCRREGDWLLLRIDVEEEEGDCRPAFAEGVRERGWSLRELHRERHTLEEAFVRMTSGRAAGSLTRGGGLP